MTLIGMPTRYGEVMLPVEVEFLFDDLEWLTRDLTYDRPVEDVIGYVPAPIGELRSGDRLRHLWKWCLVV